MAGAAAAEVGRLPGSGLGAVVSNAAPRPFQVSAGQHAANEGGALRTSAPAPLSWAQPGLGRRVDSMQRILILVLLFVIVLLQLRYWGSEGAAKVNELEAAITAQAEENERLRARNAALEAEVVDLKESRDAIEERARAELGLIAEDEVFYHVIDDADASAQPPPPERRR